MMKKAKLHGLLLLAAGLFMAAAGSAATIQVTGNISGSTTWSNIHTYVLNGFIYVLNGGTLTIEPGTIVKAKPGADSATSCLIVTAGGKIFANGTRTQPIIFTAEADDVFDPFDLPTFQRGLWGGVVLLGKSVLNTTVDVAGNAANPKYEVFEGLPDTVVGGQNVHRFGGNADNDSSGVMRYVSIRHAGVVFQPNRELNGLSLGAVGRGTTLEYIETYCTADDGFEFFGGTVNSKYLVSAFNDDDAFDIDQGYRGKGQFWFSIQEPGRKDSAGEWNGEPNTLAVGNTPIANYEIYNATFITRSIMPPLSGQEQLPPATGLFSFASTRRPNSTTASWLVSAGMVSVSTTAPAPICRLACLIFAIIISSTSPSPSPKRQMRRCCLPTHCGVT